jgi:hypothetical protein
MEKLIAQDLIDYYFPIEKPFETLKYDSEYSPFDYLEFAQQDIETDSEPRNIINAVGNAKRALHLQVDTICIGYGYKSKSRDFPPKLDFLQDIGIVAPRILKRVNKIRNRIEHDYSSPTIDEANDFIDIVELFLYATLNFVRFFPDKTVFEIGYDVEAEAKEKGFPQDIEVILEKNIGRLLVRVDSQDENILVSTQVGQSEHSEWIRALFAQLFDLPYL